MISFRRIAILLAAPSLVANAQDTGRGVSIGTGFNTGGRPGIVVATVVGSNGDSVRAMLIRDIENGHRGVIVARNAAEVPPIDGVPNYEQFAQMNASTIVVPRVTDNNELHIAIYQVREKAVSKVTSFPLTMPALSPEWRMDVHRAADQVELVATGVQGISATRIAFVRGDRIWTIDSDGANAVPVEGTSAGRSPAWHPSGRYLAFSTLVVPGGANGAIVIRDLVAGTNRRVSGARMSGTPSAPTFSPDGSMLAYAVGEEAVAICFIDDPLKSALTRCPVGGRSRNTSPSFSPDGKRIAFLSDRLNHPEVYIADVDGSNVRLLTEQGIDQSKRTDPAWSPDGARIAYTAEIDNRFQIMLIAPSGKENQALTSESENEDPFWAPDGRHIAFTSNRGGSRQLWVLDTQTGVARQLTHGDRVSYGAWSPLLPNKE